MLLLSMSLFLHYHCSHHPLPKWLQCFPKFSRPKVLLLLQNWCWERLKAGGERDDRGWDGWMASSTQWTWVWVNSGSWQWTGKPGMLQSVGSQRVGHNWVTELNWTECSPHPHTNHISDTRYTVDKTGPKPKFCHWTSALPGRKGWLAVKGLVG